MKREILEIERLIRDDQRFTVADHEKWQADLRASQAHPAPADELDEMLADPIDDALADPVLDHLPQYRNSKSRSRLLDILDQLNREGTK